MAVIESVQGLPPGYQGRVEYNPDLRVWEVSVRCTYGTNPESEWEWFASAGKVGHSRSSYNDRQHLARQAILLKIALDNRTTM